MPARQTVKLAAKQGAKKSQKNGLISTKKGGQGRAFGVLRDLHGLGNGFPLTARASRPSDSSTAAACERSKGSPPKRTR